MVIKSATSMVTIDKDTVIKRVTNFISYDVYNREIFWLRCFNEKGYDWCPKLLSLDPKNNIIKMSYMGVPINKDNAPKDWEHQLKSIIDTLHAENIYHNDIKVGEVLVQGDKINLIDYGWMSIGNDWSCNGKFKKCVKPAHKFLDENAIPRIQKSIE